MLNSIPPQNVGVYPDGKPVVYDSKKANGNTTNQISIPQQNVGVYSDGTPVVYNPQTASNSKNLDVNA